MTRRVSDVVDDANGKAEIQSKLELDENAWLQVNQRIGQLIEPHPRCR